MVDYTPLVVKDVIIAGIADPDILKETLGWSELDSKTDREVVSFVEDKEIARNAFDDPLGGQSSNAGISAYSRSKKSGESNEELEVKRLLALTGKCKSCGQNIKLYAMNRYKRINKTPFKMCTSCFKSSKTSGGTTFGSGHAKQAEFSNE